MKSKDDIIHDILVGLFILQIISIGVLFISNDKCAEKTTIESKYKEVK